MAKKERKYIKIRGASEHNLKCVSLDIPRDEFVVFYRTFRLRQVITGI